MLVSVAENGDMKKFVPTKIDSLDKLKNIVLSKNYSFGYFLNNERRKENFVTASAIGIDIDGGMSIEEAKETVKEFKHIIATTRNHQKEKNGITTDRFRIILFLSKEVKTAKDFEATWHDIAKVLPAADKACKDASRFFFASNEIVSVNEGGDLIEPTSAVEAEAAKKESAPAPVLTLLPNQKGTLARTTLDLIAFGAKEGGRNHALYKATRDLFQNGFTLDEAHAALTGPMEKSGLSAEEIKQTIDSAYSKDPIHAPRVATVPERAFQMIPIGELYKTKFEKDWIVSRLLPAGGLSIFSGAPKSGKCLGRGTMVRMFNGSIKAVENVIVGDQLMGDDNLPRNVLSVCSGTENLYRVNQKYANSYVVNESHILSLKCSSSYKKIFKGELFDLSVKEYLSLIEDPALQKRIKGYHVPIEYPEQKIEIDPYFLGVWLGDGHSDNQRITNPEPEILEYLRYLGDKLNLNITAFNNTGGCPTVSLVRKIGSSKQNPLLELMKENNLIKNKHIPYKYLINSRENRLKLLAGLLDTDSWYDKHHNSYEYTTKSEKLAEDIFELGRSLGFRIKITPMEKYCIYKGEKQYGLYYRIDIRGNDLNEIPCLVERKKPAPEWNDRFDNAQTPIKLEPLGPGEYFGFEIDGNRRFLLEDYTVTHNTTIIRQLVRATLRGEKFLERECKRGTVFWFGLEEQQEDINAGFKKLGIQPDEPLHVHVGAPMSEKVMEDLMTLLCEARPTIAVVDTLFDLIQVESENNYNEIKKQMTKLRLIARASGTHIIGIHHNSKGTDQGGFRGARAILGSTALTGGTDTNIVIERQEKRRYVTAEGRSIRPWESKEVIFDANTLTYSLGPDAEEEDTWLS